MPDKETIEAPEFSLPIQHALEGYISQRGYICLKQETYNDGDQVITILPENVPTVIQWLQELLTFAKEHDISPCDNE